MKYNELKKTVALMKSDDYKERFKAEYYQLKIRLGKLKSFCDKIELEEILYESGIRSAEPTRHDCPLTMLRKQQEAMERYLIILESRAEIEGIDL